MRIFCVFNATALNASGGYVAYYDQVLENLKNAGTIAVEERAFIAMAQRGDIVRTDRIVCFFTSDDLTSQIFAATTPDCRWMYLVDTKVRDDGTCAYEGRIKQFQQLNVRNVLITYPIPRDTQVLVDAGVRAVVMPCCAPKRRQRTQKHLGVVTSGSTSPSFYPTRTRLFGLLTSRLPGIAGSPVLKTSMEIYRANGKTPTLAPHINGEAYHQMLDDAQMGVVCRAGVRDYMVAKYVEFGAAHVLPVGDCPSYMPPEMKRLMVNVEGMTDDAVVAEVKRLLSSPVEMQQRQDAYCELTHRFYDAATHSRRVINELSR